MISFRNIPGHDLDDFERLKRVFARFEVIAPSR